MSKPVCAVVGVGPGNGASFARKMTAKGYVVSLMARNEEYLKELAASIDGAIAVKCDVTDAASVAAAFETTKKELGAVDALLFNAGSGAFGNIEGTDASAMEKSWRVNVMGLFHCAKAVIDDMKKRGSGSIIVTGATASVRGGANFAAFASSKAAQRSLAQSMARHLGSKGIHVALVIVDGVIDLERTRGFFEGKEDDFFMQPDDIADAVVHLVEQKKSAWSFELDLRPFGEKW